MSYRVIVRPIAERDITEAQLWYDEQRKGLGREFREEVGRVLEQLERSPLIYPLVEPRTRRVVLRRFPYLLYFSLEGEDVKVLACLHSHRDPSLLQPRLE